MAGLGPQQSQELGAPSCSRHSAPCSSIPSFVFLRCLDGEGWLVAETGLPHCYMEDRMNKNIYGVESKSCASSTCHTPVSRYNIQSLETTDARDIERVE